MFRAREITSSWYVRVPSEFRLDYCPHRRLAAANVYICRCTRARPLSTLLITCRLASPLPIFPEPSDQAPQRVPSRVSYHSASEAFALHVLWYIVTPFFFFNATQPRLFLEPLRPSWNDHPDSAGGMRPPHQASPAGISRNRNNNTNKNTRARANERRGVERLNHPQRVGRMYLPTMHPCP